MPPIAEYKPGEIIFRKYGIDIFGFLQMVWGWIKTFFGHGDPLAGGITYLDVLHALADFWNVYVIVALVFSLLIWYGWVYAHLRLKEFGDAATKGLADEEARWRAFVTAGPKKNTRRADILKHIESDNPNDWRIAIVEADIILEELLVARAYAGATTGERLRGADPASFRTLQDAWDAHKVRNRIAHEGTNFELTQRMAQTAVSQYERVFDEFGI